jgi:hypothetical protein
LADVDQYFHSTKTGMSHAVSFGKLICWYPPTGILKTIYDCINNHFPDKVEKYDNITEEISDFVSTKMVKKL